MPKSIVRNVFLAVAAVFLCAFVWSCAKKADAANSIALASPAFGDGKIIPTECTCDGKDLSPPLSWGVAPAGTKSFALTCEDPDAPGGTWTHWLYYGLPAGTTQLPQGVSAVENPPNGGRQCLNSFNRMGYGGPCPPPGQTHHYVFRIYALDSDISLQPSASLKDFNQAIKGHVLGQGELTGMYKRRP
ncbi:MAG: putative kinase inhibitor [Pedosphaera sp.]|nr:putative kinase inhibitor [Pedosphaera sp.]